MKRLLMIVGMMLAAELAAQACSCASPGSPLRSLRKAAAVFAGQAVSVTPVAQGGRLMVTFAVQRAWKGAAEKQVVVSTAAHDEACGYGFREGEAYLVYAHRQNDQLTTSICTRTKPVGQAEAEMKELDGLLQKPELINPPQGALKGRVTDTAGQPVQGILVGICADSEYLEKTRTDAKGEFLIPQVDAGENQTVCASDALGNRITPVQVSIKANQTTDVGVLQIDLTKKK